MGTFTEMDPALAWKAIEGYTDELSEAAEKQEELYSQFGCPRCECGLQKEFNPKTAWKPNKPLPQFLLKCTTCGYTIDPHTRLVITYGDASKTPTPNFIPIIGQ